ncbi:MAG: AMP-binding protein [Rhodospirillales bacterium]|nr:AMP-binding protein [Rhodospirillales bacterium]
MTRPAPQTVAAAILSSIARHAGRTALVAADGTTVTYGQLGDRIALAVAQLRMLGRGPGDRVGIWLPNGPDWPVWQFACALLGIVVVPLNLRYRSGELLYVLEKSRTSTIIGQSRFLNNDFLARLGEIAGGTVGEGDRTRIAPLPALERIVLLDDAAVPGTVPVRELAPQPATCEELSALALARRGTDPMWLFWTSGTTNHPKGVLVAQDAIINVWNWTTLARYGVEDRVLATFPLFYVAGHFWCMLGPLLHGATAVLGQLFTPAEVVELCRRERVTVLCGVPTMLRGFITDAAFDRTAFSHVRKGWFGGGNITPDEVATLRSAIGFDYLIQVYGMTELLGFSMSTSPEDPDEIVATTCGRPLPDMEYRLVKPGTLEDVPEGEVGELLHRGHRMLGYEAMDPQESARFFEPDGWFHTGDLMRRRADGRYEFSGRIKDLIKVAGENIAAGEIEDLLRGHPELREVAVLGVPDEQRGEVPIAFVECAPGSRIDAAGLTQWCRERAAPFKIPKAFHFVSAKDWPRTPSGKLAKWQLRTSP